MASITPQPTDESSLQPTEAREVTEPTSVMFEEVDLFSTALIQGGGTNAPSF